MFVVYYTILELSTACALANLKQYLYSFLVLNTPSSYKIDKILITFFKIYSFTPLPSVNT